MVKFVSVLFVGICLIFGVLGGYQEDMQDKAKMMAMACAKEKLINPTKLMDMMETKIMPNELNCWAQCWGKKMNLLKADGSFNSDIAAEFEKNIDDTTKAVFKDVVKNCVETVTKTSNCDSGKTLFDCLKDTPFFNF